VPPPWSRSLEGYTGKVRSVAMTPDGMRIVAGSKDNTVKVWEMATGDSRELFGNDSSINSLALSPDGRWLAYGDTVGRVWIFEWVK
jgi:WD40 repeat protein